MLRLRRCELIPLFTPLSHCHKQRQTHSLASRILFAVIVPSPLKFLIALCCLLIHALSFPQITMGYSVRIILAQCETMYERGIGCVNCSLHTCAEYSRDATVPDRQAGFRGNSSISNNPDSPTNGDRPNWTADVPATNNSQCIWYVGSH